MKGFLNIFIVVILLLFTQNSFAQELRHLINDGVDKYNNGNFNDSEIDFRKGLEIDNQNFEGYFNLGDALYKQGRYDDALKSYQNSLQFCRTKKERSEAFHNIGNSLLKSEKLQESVEAYKNALKFDPKDRDSKYNLSYALKKLKDQQNQKDQNKKDQNKDNKDQNKDQQKQDQQQNQDKQNNQDQQDKQDQQNQQNQKQDQQKQDQQKQGQQPQQQNKMSKEEAERILNALKNDEADLQKELRKHKGTVKRREKDW